MSCAQMIGVLASAIVIIATARVTEGLYFDPATQVKAGVDFDALDEVRDAWTTDLRVAY